MKKKYLVLFFTILTVSTMKAQKLPSMLTPYNDIVPTYETKINGIEFSIGVDEYRKKLFVLTNDQSFKLEGNLVIGRPLSSFKNKADIKLMKGWGYYLKIDEYWYAAFHWKDIGDDSKVVFVFQYKI